MTVPETPAAALERAARARSDRAAAAAVSSTGILKAHSPTSTAPSPLAATAVLSPANSATSPTPAAPTGFMPTASTKMAMTRPRTQAGASIWTAALSVVRAHTHAQPASTSIPAATTGTGTATITTVDSP